MYIVMFILGSILGSFICVYVNRSINGESIIKPGSHCDNCSYPLKPYDMIPIVSYILLRGKCRKCHKKIDPWAFISELGLGLLFMLSYHIYGLNISTLIAMTISCVLLSICISDFKYMTVLDTTISIGIILLILLVYLRGGIGEWYTSFLYGVFGFVLMFLIKVFGDYVFKKESLGGGDIKFAFLMGYILPYQEFLIALILGSTLALPYAFYITSKKGAGKELPFGPFLALGLLIVFLFENDIILLINNMMSV